MKNKIVGIVKSISGDQTAQVVVSVWKKAPIIKKNYRIYKKILSHNPNNSFKIGDRVVITPSKPISKRKHFIILEKVKDDSTS